MKAGVYTITNIVNNKMYVGCSTNILYRLCNHKRELKKGIHSNSYIQKAWDKYGEDSFMFEMLVECESEDMYSEENYWCNLLNVHDKEYGYNIALTNPYGHIRHSEESKKKMSQYRKGRKMEKASWTGKKHSPETLLKMKESAKNREWSISKEGKEKTLAAIRKYKITEESRQKISNYSRGSGNARAKLKEEVVTAIKQEIIEKTLNIKSRKKMGKGKWGIIEKYNITERLYDSIRCGESWRWLEPLLPITPKYSKTS